MTMIRKTVRAQITPVGEDEVDVVMSTASLARDGHVLVPQGCRLENYQANPIVLWSHDPDCPIGNVTDIAVDAHEIRARIKFAPLGISQKADEIRGLMKAGVVRAVSVGFDPLEGEPLDPKKPRGGQRFTDWELLELSGVSVGADTGALVTQRANGDHDMSETPETDSAAPQPARKVRKTRAARTRAPKITFTRGLYEVAELCWLFQQLGYQLNWAEWEAAAEGDGSKVPGMLAGVLHDLGDALLAMTAEEISEALAGHDVEVEEDEDDAVLVVEERAHIAAASSPAVRAFRRGLARAKLRAGKTLSAETVRCLREAQDLHADAITQHRAAIKTHQAAVSAVDELMDRAGVSDPDDETAETVQTSSGTDVSEGSANGRAGLEYRRRQLDLLALSAER